MAQPTNPHPFLVPFNQAAVIPQRLPPNVQPPSSPANQLAPNCETMAVKACTLMGLPVEIRLKIYEYLFGNSNPIMAVTNDEGYLSFTDQPQLHLPSLRCCKKFLLEACPIMYGVNTFAVTFNDVHRLAKLRQRSCICIQSLVILPETPVEQALPNQNLVQPLTVGFPTAISAQPLPVHPVGRIGPPCEVLALGTIGNAFGSLKNLSVNPSAASSLLALVLQLSSSLPCSPIRDWPLLEVTIHVQKRYFGDNTPGVGLSLSRQHEKWLWLNRRLSALTVASNLGLGYEMPSFKTIHVQGRLTWEDCLLIEEHRSSFGDCSFKKEIMHDSGAADNNDSKYRYTWRRVDDDEQQAKARNAAVDMRRFLPRLSDKYQREVLASF